jgi:ATP-dependent Clp protease protease subunit
MTLITGLEAKASNKTDIELPGLLMRKNAVLMLTGEFNQINIMPLVQDIMEFNFLPEKDQPEHITLVINSPGGAVHSAFHLIDVMKTSKIPVHTYAQGMIASCGVLTFMAGAKGHRYITHNTSVMSHQYSWGSQGKEHELYAKIKEFELSSERMIEHYKTCTGKTEKYIRKNLLTESDVWMSADEAKKHGIADKVVKTY